MYRPNYVKFSLTDTLDKYIWMSIYIVLSFFIFTWLLLMLGYLKTMPPDCKVKNDPILVIMTIFGGLTEPINIKFFKYGIAGTRIVLMQILYVGTYIYYISRSSTVRPLLSACIL